MNDQNRRIVNNTIAQYCRIIISAILAILSTRYVLKQLGVDDYGIFSVVAGFISFLGFLNNSLLVSVQRFLSYEIPTSNETNINRIYNTSTFIHISFAVCLLIFAETVGKYFLVNYMSFPDGQLNNAITVFHCVVISFVINVISIPQQALLVAYEKIQVFSIIGVLESVLRFACAVSLKFYPGNRLIYYSVIFLIISLIVRLLYTIVVRRLCPFITSRILPDKFYLKNLFSFASWNTLGAVANLSRTQGVNILLNMFWGTSVNAAFGLANQLNSQFTFFQSSIFQAANSQVIQAYRLNDTYRLTNLIERTTKYAFILYGSVVFSIWIGSYDLLSLWLNKVPEYCNVFVKLMIVNSCIELFSTPLMYLVQASGKIKIYFIVISVVMLLILPISYLLLRLGAEPQIVLVITICINIILLFLRLLYVYSYVGYDTKRYFFKVIVPSCLLILIMFPISELYSHINHISIRVLILVICPILTIVLSYFFILNPDERKQIIIYAKEIITKLIRTR